MHNYEELELVIVEDNNDDAELIIRTLKKHKIGDKYIHLKDGVEALEFLFGSDHQKYPKLILLDLKMPRVDGFEVLRQIRAHESTKFIPVVIMTSSNQERDIIKGYNLGVNSFITKPLDFVEFGEAIKRMGNYWLLINKDASNMTNHE